MRRLFRWSARHPARALLIYWPIAFIVTHIPPIRERSPDAPRPLIQLDKLAHFIGFIVLAWLLVHLLNRRLRPAVAIALTILICMIYGIVDELTQPPFNRTADPWDFIADLAGCAAGIALALLALREQHSRNELR